MNVTNKDLTPRNFSIEVLTNQERLKKIIRKYLYPPFLKYRNIIVAKKFEYVKKIGFSEVFIGQKGTDYEALRRKVNKVKKIKDSTILIVGIGTGRELETWLRFKPKKIIAVDCFNYDRAWKMRIKQFKNKYNIEIEFLISDIVDLKTIKDGSIDIVGSDAVFEHVNKFPEAVSEIRRVLTDNGVLYAGFGPLWYSYGGDHISGSDFIKNAYNHLLLNNEQYAEYMDSFGEYEHSELDGRTWWKHNLFSYLRPKEYLDALSEGGFSKIYNSCVIDRKALKFQNKYPNKYKKLINRFGRENLLISGMTIIYAKK